MGYKALFDQRTLCRGQRFHSSDPVSEVRLQRKKSNLRMLTWTFSSGSQRTIVFTIVGCVEFDLQDKEGMC